MEYSLPAHVAVSPECRDLLARLLVANPRARLTIQGIWQHPWFRLGLPPGVEHMNAQLLANPETFSGPGQQARPRLGALEVACSGGTGGSRACRCLAAGSANRMPY